MTTNSRKETEMAITSRTSAATSPDGLIEEDRARRGRCSARSAAARTGPPTWSKAVLVLIHAG